MRPRFLGVKMDNPQEALFRVPRGRFCHWRLASDVLYGLWEDAVRSGYIPQAYCVSDADWERFRAAARDAIDDSNILDVEIFEGPATFKGKPIYVGGDRTMALRRPLVESVIA